MEQTMVSSEDKETEINRYIKHRMKKRGYNFTKPAKVSGTLLNSYNL